MIDLAHGLSVLRVVMRHSRANPVTGEVISATTGISTREIAEVVSVAASMGIRVASCSSGYYHPTDAEVREYLAREKSRLISLGRKISGVKKNADNPLSLFEQDAA
jgi:biotin operon repressor